MRVIYLVRGAQLLVTLCAIWMLYSVSEFCEETTHEIAQCPALTRGLPLVAPEQNALAERMRKLRPASNRLLNTSDASSPSPDSTTTAHATPRAESSTVTSPESTVTEEVKKRVKRDERKVLPGNGMTEGQQKAAKTKEAVKEEESKDAVKVEDTTPAHDEVKKKGVEKPELIDAKKSEDKREEPTTRPVPTETTKAVPAKEENKEQRGAKVEIPVASGPSAAHTSAEAKMEILNTAESSSSSNHITVSKVVEINVTDSTGKSKVEIPVAGEATSTQANSNDDSKERHHTVKKDLKAHVQEPTKIEKKEVRVPKLAPVQEHFVLEHANAHLLEVRCLGITSDDYFGRQISPYGENLKGLAIVGPVLVVICIYLVCTVLRTRLGNEDPTEFIHTLGCVFHMGMWLVVGVSMYFILDHWKPNWNAVSNATFLPEFPRAWFGLMVLSSFMMLAVSIETWFHKKLFFDLVLERSYRCYEVIENDDVIQNQGRFKSGTNVY